MNPYELRQKFYNFATANAPWYKIVNQATGPTQIHLFNSIGGAPGSTSAGEFLGALDEIEGAVELYINSEGGEVFQAKPIYNALSRRSDVKVVIDGLAASAASFVAMAASPGKLYMSKIGTMMIHDGHAIAYGNSVDLSSLASALDRESDTIAGIYADRSGKEASYFRDKMRKETWYNSAQALEEGLCDGILDMRTGGVITNSLDNAASRPYVSETQTRHAPMTGRHSHDHAAGDASDHDDGQHIHMHEHHNDADHVNHKHGAGAGNEGADDNDSGSRSGMLEYSVDGQEIIMASAFPEAVFYDRAFTTEQRQKLAKSGAALKDGSYPIENCQDAENARRAYGRAPQGKRAAVAAHIRKRESALSCKVEPFKPGSSDTSSLVISDEEAANFAASIRL